MFLKPFMQKRRITDISPEELSSLGVKVILLDVDNTLSTHHGSELTDGLIPWLESVKTLGIRPILVSNSVKKRIIPFAENIGIDFVAPSLKPLPVGYSRALKKLKASKRDALTVGDQLFTDVIGGNLFGIKTVLVTPVKPETSLRFRIKRKIEKAVMKIIKLNWM